MGSKMIFKKVSKVSNAFAVSGLVGMTSLTGCLTASSQTTLGDGNATLNATSGKTYQRDAVACNPLTSPGAPAIDYNLGLAARLFYSPAGQPQYTAVEDYFNKGTDLGVDIFFNDVNVPESWFANGFPSEAGPAFQTPDGTTLIEWFGIRYSSILRLTANDQPGDYQFAILSDDGAILSLDPTNSGTLTSWINNDGEHPSQLGCATQTIAMNETSNIPMQLDYYQGPRYHITNMLLWRKIPTGGSLSDVACGVSGDSLYFNSTASSSAVLPYFDQLLARGWSIVPAENFVLPNENPGNPCFPNSGLFGN